MKTRIFAGALAAAAVMLAGPVAMMADENSCSVATIAGSFGYTVTGTINTPATPQLPPGPFAAVGRLVFNGRGGLSTVRTLSVNGTIIRADSGSGTYSVNSDCTGSFDVSVGTPSLLVKLNLDLVIANQGNQIRAIGAADP
ncbi:MAG: hypothetical protein ACR2I2_05010 [Bryobacteraceae bacterium]